MAEKIIIQAFFLTKQMALKVPLIGQEKLDQIRGNNIPIHQ
jgi:hypothetical protein